MKCPNCGSEEIEVIDIFDTEIYEEIYTEKGCAECRECDGVFDFVKNYKLELKDVKYY